MSKIKIMLLFCFVLSLNGCSKEKPILDTSNLYTETAIPEKTALKTDKVIVGDYIKETFCKATYHLPKKEIVTTTMENGATAILTEFLIESGKTVKKGEPIATITVEYDKITLESKELQFNRAKENYYISLEAKHQELITAENKYNAMTNGIDKDIYALQIKKLKMGYENYKKTTSDQLKEQEEEIQKLKECIKQTQIIAPIDGLIQLGKLSDRTLNNNTVVATIYSMDAFLLKAFDDSGTLRYGMDVTIQVGTVGGKQTYKGKVISSHNVLNNGLSANEAYVKILDNLTEIPFSNNITVHYQSINVKNVLLVHPAAVYIDQLKVYASVLEKDIPKKQYITTIGKNEDYYWVVEGLKEGQTVILK